MAALREEFLVKRVERRQAETLIKETEARDRSRQAGAASKGWTDWFGNRMHRKDAEAAPKESRETGRNSRS